MANLKRARRNLKTVAVVLLLVDVAAAGFLLSPLGRSPRSQQQEYDRVRLELQAKIREVVPLRGMDRKLGEAQRQIGKFYKDRLPGGYSSISAELGKLAQESGVRISQGKYDSSPAELKGLQQVKMEATLEGDYLPIVKFINALERDKMFFIVDSVTLGQEQGGAVRLQLKLETYLKSEG